MITVEELESRFKRTESRADEMFEEICRLASESGVDWRTFNRLNLFRETAKESELVADYYRPTIADYDRTVAALPPSLQSQIKQERELRGISSDMQNELVYRLHQQGQAAYEIAERLGLETELIQRLVDLPADKLLKGITLLTEDPFGGS